MGRSFKLRIFIRLFLITALIIGANRFIAQQFLTEQLREQIHHDMGRALIACSDHVQDRTQFVSCFKSLDKGTFYAAGIVAAPSYEGFPHFNQDLAIPAELNGAGPEVGRIIDGERKLFRFRRDALQGLDEGVDVGDPVLEQVADPLRPVGQQLGGVPLLDVLRQHQHGDTWVPGQRLSATRAWGRAELRAPLALGGVALLEPWVAGNGAGYVFGSGAQPALASVDRTSERNLSRSTTLLLTNTVVTAVLEPLPTTEPAATTAPATTSPPVAPAPDVAVTTIPVRRNRSSKYPLSRSRSNRLAASVYFFPCLVMVAPSAPS